MDLQMVLSLVLIILSVTLLKRTGEIMASLQEVKDQLAVVAAGVDGLEQKVKELKEQLAAGSPVTQADLDALFDQVAAIGADIADDSDQ